MIESKSRLSEIWRQLLRSSRSPSPHPLASVAFILGSLRARSIRRCSSIQEVIWWTKQTHNFLTSANQVRVALALSCAARNTAEHRLALTPTRTKLRYSALTLSSNCNLHCRSVSSSPLRNSTPSPRAPRGLLAWSAIVEARCLNVYVFQTLFVSGSLFENEKD